MQRVNLEISAYILGICWSIGSFIEGRSVFRHRSKYHISLLQSTFGGTMYCQDSRTGPQYVLKTRSVLLSELDRYAPRNASSRDVPELDDYRDFLRAYFELHATPSWQTSYSWHRRRTKYYRLRYRIFGNTTLLTSIQNILAEYGIRKVAIQPTQGETSSYIQHTDVEQIMKICRLLNGQPCCAQYWDNLYLLLQNPRRYGVDK